MDTHSGLKKYELWARRQEGGRQLLGDGYSTKSVLMNDQEVEIKVPRDRNGEFEPQIVKKYEKRWQPLQKSRFSRCIRGAVQEMQAHIEEIYGSGGLPRPHSRVTDAVAEDVRDAEKPPA